MTARRRAGRAIARRVAASSGRPKYEGAEWLVGGALAGLFLPLIGLWPAITLGAGAMVAFGIWDAHLRKPSPKSSASRSARRRGGRNVRAHTRNGRPVQSYRRGKPQ